MKANIPSKAEIAKRATDESKEFAVIAAYLYVCFTAILYLKASILEAQNIEFAPFGFAAVKALIRAKFVSLGRTLHVGERLKSLPLIWPTLYKSVAFLAFLIVLNALEEIAAGAPPSPNGRSLAEFGGGKLDQLIATSIVSLLILIPFFALRILGEAVGERNLVRVFFILATRPADKRGARRAAGRDLLQTYSGCRIGSLRDNGADEAGDARSSTTWCRINAERDAF